MRLFSPECADDISLQRCITETTVHVEISYTEGPRLVGKGVSMNIKNLRKHYNPMPESLELISHEGDIYLCRINKKEMLTDNSGKHPMVFHSIGEARDTIGEPLASKLQVVYSTAYDEMINI